MEKIVATLPLKVGKMMTFEALDIDFGNGKVATYERVRFNQNTVGVLVVPVVDKEYVYLLEQYQVGAETRMWVLPRGGVPNGVMLEDHANVELQEEIGYKAGILTHIGYLDAMPGYISGTSNVFLAEDLISSKLKSGDEHEDLVVKLFSFLEIFDMVSKGEIRDARTVAGIFMAHEFITKRLN